MRTGHPIRSLNSRDLFEVAYALMLDASLVDKERYEAQEKFERKIRDIVLEDETGVPAVVRQFASADASLMGGGSS